MSCSGLITAAGDPTLVITTSTLCFTRHFRSSAMVACRIIRFGQIGAPAPASSFSWFSMLVNHASSSLGDCAFAVGNAPITPARLHATTMSGPDTRSIGAAIKGRRNRSQNFSANGVFLIIICCPDQRMLRSDDNGGVGYLSGLEKMFA